MGPAIDDDAVLELLGAIDLQLAVARQPVVPAAVPDGHEVGVFLPGAGQLRAGQRLNVEIAVGVRIGFQIDLRLRSADAEHRHRAQRYREFHVELQSCESPCVSTPSGSDRRTARSGLYTRARSRNACRSESAIGSVSMARRAARNFPPRRGKDRRTFNCRETSPIAGARVERSRPIADISALP